MELKIVLYLSILFFLVNSPETSSKTLRIPLYSRCSWFEQCLKRVIQQEPLSRGHMNPVAINTFNINFMKATFTLTNTIPQYVASNSGPRQIFETKIRRYAADVCGSQACRGTFFLLTGPTEFSPGNYLEENGELFHSKVILSSINLAIP